ncbi:hypothetical protein V494_01661 [Pseudogymnoascus sp. VKM F-4513 (FW-928)]|nr:hypothetical protein V494_01661 [Pseudogymnoascus sp. VKM F-4513 (FW-928)]
MRTDFLAALLATAATCTSAFAIPQHQSRATCPDIPTFQATNYEYGCSPGGCSSNFNVTAAAGYRTGAPGFNVVCSPIFIQQLWVPCRNTDGSELPADSRVESIWTDGPDRERQFLGVAHIYQRDDGKTVNATARTDILAEKKPLNFLFPVTIFS